MKPLVYYYCPGLSPAKSGRATVSLGRLARLLALPPVSAICPIAPLPSKVEKDVLDALEEPDIRVRGIRVGEVMSTKIGYLPTGEQGRCLIPRLLVSCHTAHPLAQSYLKVYPTHLWGSAGGVLAVVYDGGEVAVWHELLHLLGANDCYDANNPHDNPGPTCEHPRCIMQYAAPARTIDEDKLPICRENARRIRDVLAQIRETE